MIQNYIFRAVGDEEEADMLREDLLKKNVQMVTGVDRTG